MKTKGQAAMEFLTTYGWAFLAILVAVGGLSYFGVFDFSQYQTTSFTLDGKLSAGEAFSIDLDYKEVSVQLKNNYAQTIDVGEIVIYEKSKTIDEADCTFPLVDTVSINSNKMGIAIFDISGEIDCGLLANAGDKKTFIVKIKTKPVTSSISNVAVGEMTANIATMQETSYCKPNDCNEGDGCSEEEKCVGTVIGEDTDNCYCTVP